LFHKYCDVSSVEILKTILAHHRDTEIYFSVCRETRLPRLSLPSSQALLAGESDGGQATANEKYQYWRITTIFVPISIVGITGSADFLLIVVSRWVNRNSASATSVPLW
jgi:hypothetical protein